MCHDVLHISIAMKNNKSTIALYQKLSNEITELNMLLMQDPFSDTKWLEILPKDCSKYHAIKQLSNYLKISNDEIIAFGDGLNDMEMIQKFGHGIALKNALPEVKAVADDITNDDYNHDGVIHYLKELFATNKK